MTYMLDTNICIYAMNNYPNFDVRQKINAILNSDGCISSISYAELKFGAYKSSRVEENLTRLEEFKKRRIIIPFEEEDAIEYGKIRAYLQKAGTPIGPLDTLIAAHAKTLGYTLVTNNTREFERVPGLKLENWTAVTQNN